MPSNCGHRRLGDDQRARARVAQHEVVVAGGEQGVGGDRHDAGLDAAEEGGREVDGVEQAQHDAALGPDAEVGEHVAEAVHPLGEFAICIAAGIVDEGGLVAAPGLQVALDQVPGGVVVARHRHARRCELMIGRG